MRTHLCLLLALCSCGSVEKGSVDTRSESRKTSVHLAQEFAPEIRDIAFEFRNWTRLGTIPSFAPELCISPPLSPLVSDSRDQGTHGRKLYFLYVKDIAAYDAATESDQPIGQALVKESFEAIPISSEEKSFQDTLRWGQTISKDGKHWRLGPARDLFVMYKLDPKTPNTDQGWVYGTCSITMNVSSAGRVESCMECHEEATRDRVFGAKD